MGGPSALGDTNPHRLPEIFVVDALHLLAKLAPPAELVWVGAGQAHDHATYKDLQPSRVLCVEANSELMPHLRSRTAQLEGWHAVEALVGGPDGPAHFYVTTNGNENGLLHPDSLRLAWRNLARRDTRVLPTTTLDELLLEQGFAPDWLVIDCLSWETVLAGAEKTLGAAKILVVRIVTEKLEAALPRESEAALGDALRRFGFLRLVRLDERNPAFAHLVLAHPPNTHESSQNYADLQHRVAAFSASAEEKEKQHIATKAELHSLHAEIGALKSQHLAALDDLEKNRISSLERETALSAELQEAQRERDEQARWHDENAKWAKSLQAELAGVRAEALAAAESATEQSEKLRDELANAREQGRREVSERDARLEADGVRLSELEKALEIALRERDEQAHWHNENAKWAKSLKEKLEESDAQLASASAEQEATRRLREQLAQDIRRAEEQLEWLKNILATARREELPKPRVRAPTKNAKTRPSKS